jgi:hypothetical protein
MPNLRLAFGLCDRLISSGPVVRRSPLVLSQKPHMRIAISWDPTTLRIFSSSITNEQSARSSRPDLQAGSSIHAFMQLYPCCADSRNWPRPRRSRKINTPTRDTRALRSCHVPPLILKMAMASLPPTVSLPGAVVLVDSLAPSLPTTAGVPYPHGKHTAAATSVPRAPRPIPRPFLTLTLVLGYCRRCCT